MKLIYLYLFLFFSACSLPTNEESSAVARVGENYLFISDLQDQISPRYNGDSLQITNRLINDWAEQLLYLKKAEINLSSKRTSNRCRSIRRGQEGEEGPYRHEGELAPEPLAP